MTGAVLVAILAVTPWLGTFLAMVVAAVVIPLLWGERRYGILTAFAIGLPLIVLFVFAVLLGVRLVPGITGDLFGRSEEHTSELQSLMRISYAVFCLKKKILYSNF